MLLHLLHLSLSITFTRTIDAEGGCFVVLHIRAAVLPVENVVGGKMENWNTVAVSVSRQVSCTVSVNSIGSFHTRLSSVDAGKRGGIDDKVWLQ
ncbi:hypothetical protein AXW85_28040 [Pseudomonas aeruginosa]|nr:hypothetical protein AXW85_28040 [Pseudomonas aeruginosa]